VTALPPDYDADPGRSRAFRLGWQEDVHEPVAERLVAEGVDVVVDVGCGIGRFAGALGGRVPWVGLDRSPRQLADGTRRPVVRADATQLPFGGASVGAVVALWMLYHLAEPRRALAEARRVVRPGGLVAVCASARSNDPELVPGGYPATSFDAEEAAETVADVFGPDAVEVVRWDEPIVRLADRDEVAAYARSHLLPAEAADAVVPPLTLTKRGCLVWARRT
jgi:SAM-dependent methyltransferase